MIISIFAFAVAVLGGLCFKILPAKWLCDYGEEIDDKHLRSNRVLPHWALILLGVFNGGAALLYSRMGNGFALNLSFCLVGAILLLIAVCDIYYGIIPNELLAICLVIGLFIAFKSGWQQPLYGVLIGGVGLFCVIFVVSKLMSAEAMGMGDILLSALCGVLCGALGYLAVFLTAIISAGLLFAVLLIAKKIDKRSTQPFGPFLTLGAFSALCFQPEWSAIFSWYLGF